MSIYYTVYRTTNLINLKEYIGIHITKNPYDGYLGSGVALRLSIKKYGKENFKKEILYMFDNVEEMIEKEVELVNEDYVRRDDTYNLTLGGRTGEYGELNPMFGIKISEETREKLSKIHKGIRKTKSHKEKIRAANLGKVVSEETKHKISISAKESIIKHTIMQSEEYKEKMRIALLGENNPMFGKTHTDEAKRKISESKIGKPSPYKGIKLTEEEKMRRKINYKYEKCFCCGRCLLKTAIIRFHNKNCKALPIILYLLSVFLLY